MAPGRARDEQKEQQWRRWISQWRAGSLGVRAFCARHGLATPSFYAWRRTLQQRAAEAPPARASALELVLADGRIVRVAPGFDAATLRQLLAVLEGERPC